jgi:hypothetical protein
LRWVNPTSTSNQERYVASKKQANRSAFRRARITKGSVLAASAAAALAVAPAAGARMHGHSSHHHWLGANDHLVPNSVVISSTVFPRHGVNLAIGQELPFANTYINGWTAKKLEGYESNPASADGQTDVATGTAYSASNPFIPSLSDWTPTTYATAVAPGQYPLLFNNDGPDGSFAVNTPIDLFDVSLSGRRLGIVHVPTSGMTTSFSSKSELAINAATDGQSVSFLAYGAPTGQFDASNSNTPGVHDFTNPDVSSPGVTPESLATGVATNTSGNGFYRVVGDLHSDGKWSFTDTNSYSGDNGRAALLNASDGYLFAAGNDNNGDSNKITSISSKNLASNSAAQQAANATVSGDAASVLASLVADTGAQTFPESFLSQPAQQLAGIVDASFGDLTYAPSDKPGKDTNFRGLTVFDNVVYYTKGSGSNGADTVYFVNTEDPTGSTDPAYVCPTDSTTVTGTESGVPTSEPIDAPVGLPRAGAPLPTPGMSYQMCILRGFNMDAAAFDLNDNAPAGENTFPFGIWFANADTLYIADEGSGNFNVLDPGTPYADALPSNQPLAGLQKWVFSGGQWNLAYTIQNGLDLGQPYTVPGYPTGDNSTDGGSGLPWAPATDGLRNISGRVSRNGTATIYATSSTVSGSGDDGADPNKVVAVTDAIGADGLSPQERFRTIAPARYGVRYGGVVVLSRHFGHNDYDESGNQQ